MDQSCRRLSAATRTHQLLWIGEKAADLLLAS
jgi:hypothetical protein